MGTSVTSLESLDSVPGKIPNVPETLRLYPRSSESIFSYLNHLACRPNTSGIEYKPITPGYTGTRNLHNISRQFEKSRTTAIIIFVLKL